MGNDRNRDSSGKSTNRRKASAPIIGVEEDMTTSLMGSPDDRRTSSLTGSPDDR